MQHKELSCRREMKRIKKKREDPQIPFLVSGDPRFDCFVERRTFCASGFPCRWLWNAPTFCARISRREPATGLLRIQHGVLPCIAQCLCVHCRMKCEHLSMGRRSDDSDTCPRSCEYEFWQSRHSRNHKRQLRSVCPSSG